jgi:hypothetical protein
VKAQCQCGQLSIELPGSTPAVVACHCIACQRRTGSPFGVLAYYAADQLTIVGEAKRFERQTEEGNSFESFFCPECGSTVDARSDKHPAMIGWRSARLPIGDLQLPSDLFGSSRCTVG